MIMLKKETRKEFVRCIKRGDCHTCPLCDDNRNKYIKKELSGLDCHRFLEAATKKYIERSCSNVRGFVLNNLSIFVETTKIENKI